MAGPQDRNTGKRFLFLTASIVVSVLLIYAALWGVYGVRKWYLKSHENHLVEQVLAKMPARAFEQKEFSRAYIVWMTKYCVTRDFVHKFTPEQVVTYCACFQDQKVSHMSMKEEMDGMNAGWNPTKVPAISKKIEAFETTCLQETLK